MDTKTPAGRIEETLLGGPRRYNRVQVSEVTGVDRDRAQRLWMAMGFAEVGDDEAVFTDGDIEALRTWAALVASGTMALEDEVPHARVMGQTLSRLAEWQAREVMARADVLAPSGAGRAAAADMADTLLPVIEHLQSYVWRRHLAAAYERILLAPPGELSAATMTVGFADIVGFTRTARHAAIEDLAALLETFEEDTSEAVVSNHGRVVKMVGDEVLFVTDQPADAAEIALRLTSPGRPEQGLPALRVGMAAGRVLTRFGDVYGPVVNLAARLTSLARPGTALVDAELAGALRTAGNYRLQARRPAAVRGYHHLRSWALRPAR
ncbi:MAG TPA: adenylate/guanylate cyclase domain-containing protein [Streptosporangiaceae bacterium]|jgi:adenylate cyclase